MILETLFPEPFIDLKAHREVAFPRQRVWEWMITHPAELLATEGYHARVEPARLPIAKGDRIMIHHELPLGIRESRHARINKLAPYVIGFGEVSEPGVYDFFPHSYRFSLAELDAETTVVGFDIRGRFRIPGGRFLWMPWFRQLAPARLQNLLGRLDLQLCEALG